LSDSFRQPGSGDGPDVLTLDEAEIRETAFRWGDSYVGTNVLGAGCEWKDHNEIGGASVEWVDRKDECGTLPALLVRRRIM